MTNFESLESPLSLPDSVPDASSSETRVDPLVGARIFIVEDNPFICDALEELLSEHGLIVAGVARKLKEAIRLAESIKVDLALLDVNIGGQQIDPVAEALTLRAIPVVFSTGYGRAGLPEAFVDRPVVEKPFHIESILAALRDALLDSARKSGVD